MSRDAFSYLHINALVSGTVTPIVNTGVPTAANQGLGPGTILRHVTINKAGASANLLTIYDGNASTDPVIAVIDTTTSRTLHYKIVCNKGLSYDLATGTAADITVAFS